MGGVDISGTKETTRSYGLVHFGSVIQNVQKCRTCLDTVFITSKVLCYILCLKLFIKAVTFLQ